MSSNWLESVLQDVRYAWRALRRSPAFTVVAVLALALGVGANTAIFTVLYGVLFRPLPYPDGQQVVWLEETFPPGWTGSVSWLNWRDWREQNNVFTDLCAFQFANRNLQGTANPERLRTIESTANLFSILGNQPLRGRTFQPDEDQPNRPPVAIISEGLWERRFSREESLVGKTITLDGLPHTVIGIMPASFVFPSGSAQTEVWLPLKPPEQTKASRGSHMYLVMGRLKPDTALSKAQEQMKAIAQRIEKAHPETQQGRSVNVKPFQEALVGYVRPTLWMLLGAVCVLLLIACANVANLLLARATVRHKEIALRLAVGASAGRIIRQLMTESLLLSLLGGAAGLVIAYAGTSALATLPARVLPRAEQISINPIVFAYLFGVCLLCGLIFGLVPAWQTVQSGLRDSLQEGGSKGAVGSSRPWLRHSLMVTEFALALILLVGAGLMMRTLLGLKNTPSGLNVENVLTAQLSVPTFKYKGENVYPRFFAPLIEKLQSTPGVRAAGLISHLPLSESGFNGGFTVEGRPPDRKGEEPYAEYRFITPGYFAAAGVPVAEGRDIAAGDGDGAPSVVVVNRTLAQRYYPQGAVGRRMSLDDGKTWTTIAGVVADVRNLGLDQRPFAELYVPLAQAKTVRPMNIVVRATVPATSLTAVVRETVRSVDHDQPIYRVRTLEQVVSESLADRSLYLTLLGIFAFVALLLAASGLYGVMSYLVAQRTQEFGIRMVLGAAVGDVVGLVLRQSARLLVIGTVLGLAGSAILSRFLESWLFGVSPTDPITFALSAVVLAVVALLAVYIPARRATRVDPLVALRHE